MINSIRVNFIMQFYLRFMDYIFNQFLAVVLTPQKFSSNNFYENEEKIKINEEIVRKTPDEILKAIENKLLMLISIKIINTEIILKPNPISNNFLIINLGSILITNTRKKKKKIGINNKKENFPSFSDYYSILIKNISLKTHLNNINQIIEISNNFNLNLQVEIPLFNEEYKNCIEDNVQIDNSIKILIKIFPASLIIEKEDINLLFKIIYCNILFDDLLDDLFYYKFKLQTKKIISQESSINFNFCIDNII